MRYRTLGKTGLKVSELSFGVYSLTGMYGEVEEEKAIKILKLAAGLGINLFDTADVYGQGYGEKILRRAFGDSVKEILVATKAGYDFYSNPGKPARRYDPEYIEFAVRMSIERVGKRPLDLLQIHNPPLEELRRPELYAKLRELVEKGYVDHVGVALGPEKHVESEAEEALAHEEVESVQIIYNALEQRPGREIALRAHEKGVGILVRVPHAGGILSERLGRGDAGNLKDHRALRERAWLERAFGLYDKIRPLLRSTGSTPGQAALRFILSSIPASSVILIATSEEELSEYVEASEQGPLAEDVVRSVARLYEEEGL